MLRAALAARGAAVGRTQRLGGEQREDIREDQLLVLLLVVDAELDQLRNWPIAFDDARLEDCIDRRIDMPAVAHALPRATGASAARAWVAAGGGRQPRSRS